MRPIKLKIKGLNSFIEEQTIDFEKLTDRGLFGIFGPTGSGKSTVLDGITLALYGDVSRKSSNYINTNCDRLNVSFEFQISGAETKRYLVNREFKRDKKSGNPVSGKCKIVDITNGEEVLADKVKTVTDKCKEVIGLSLEDFTRTVVLPQGKFSEFLKLEGKPRREMLERLFNLGEYGDKLSSKLSKQITKERTENSVLLGQLMGYEDISEEKKREKEEELNISIGNLEKANEELKAIEKSFKENTELWNMQLEVKDYKTKESKLIEKADEINLFKDKVKAAEAANKVNPYIISYEETLKNINFTEKELSELKVKCEELKEKKAKFEEEWNKARINKDSKLPEYKVQEEKIKEAIKDKKALIDLENEIKEINKRADELLKKKKENNEKLIDCEKRLKKGNELLKEKEEYRDTLNIERELKENVQEGVVITRDYNNLFKIVNEYKVKIEANRGEVKKYLDEICRLISENGGKAISFVDSNTLPERYIAYLAGIGFIGKNNMIITKDYGSYVFLGEIITDLTLFDKDKRVFNEIEKFKECGQCDICYKECPTKSINEIKKNPNICSSYITQKKDLSDIEIKLLKGKIFGCDMCQNKCPYNEDVKFSNIGEFKPLDFMEESNCEIYAGINNKAFKENILITSCGWRGKNIIKRNAIIRLHNEGRDIKKYKGDSPYLNDYIERLNK